MGQAGEVVVLACVDQSSGADRVDAGKHATSGQNIIQARNFDLRRRVTALSAAV
jgi:hypothetical protein